MTKLYSFKDSVNYNENIAYLSDCFHFSQYGIFPAYYYYKLIDKEYKNLSKYERRIKNKELMNQDKNNPVLIDDIYNISASFDTFETDKLKKSNSLKNKLFTSNKT